MKGKILWLILTCLLVLSLLLASCGTKTTPTTTQTTTPTTIPTTKPLTTPTTKPTTTSVTTTGNWWDKLGVPQYGSTMTMRMNADLAGFDPWQTGFPIIQGLHMEFVAMSNWTIDRKVFSFQGAYTPTIYRSGLLAENWDQPDLQTIVA